MKSLMQLTGKMYELISEELLLNRELISYQEYTRFIKNELISVKVSIKELDRELKGKGCAIHLKR